MDTYLAEQVVETADRVVASGAISHNGHGNVSIRVPGSDEMSFTAGPSLRDHPLADVVRVEGDRTRRPEHVDAVAARALDQGDLREDRVEGSDVVVEIGCRTAVREPLHHDPAVRQVIPAGLVGVAPALRFVPRDANNLPSGLNAMPPS